MDIKEYVAAKERRLSDGTSRIADLKVFDYNYVPKRPLMRDELEPVIDALIRYEKTGIGNHILISGSRGCGR